MPHIYRFERNGFMKNVHAKMTFRLILISFLALMLIGCGESGSPGGGSGVGATASINLAAGAAELPADGVSSTAITANLTDSTGAAVNEFTTVKFSTTNGMFSNGKKEYKVNIPDDAGSVIVTLQAGTTPGTAVVTAESNRITQKVELEFTSIEKPTPAKLSLGISGNSVLTDNSDSVTITALVQDANGAPVQDVTVQFNTVAPDGSSGAGQISHSSLMTDENGLAEILFSSGVGDKRNHIVTLEATVDEIGTKQIPIEVTGTYLSVSVSGETNIEVGGEPSGLKISVFDAANQPVFDAPVNLSVSADSNGLVLFDPATGKTDINGEFNTTIKGTRVGPVTVEVESLGAIGSQAYTIDDTDKAFQIIEPIKDPTSIDTNEELTVTVRALNYDKVVFATSLGGWVENSKKVIEKPVINGEVSAIFSSSDAGTPTIQVYPSNDPGIRDLIRLAISAPSSEASKISLQASATVVAPSSQDVKNSVTLIAEVTNSKNQIVKGAPVLFSIVTPTGGGEYVSPTISFTNSLGIATSSFTSGALVAGADGVQVSAELIDSGALDTVSIIISRKAASVAIGRSTEIESINDGTAYKLPMSVLVTDANGSPAPQATVSLNAWPAQYGVGIWVPQLLDSNCEPVYEIIRPNEDKNRNLIMDPDEDVNLNGQLTPPSSAAGSVPETVVTDQNGVANFELIYLKANAAWIIDDITASTVVSGTETTSTYRMTLPWSKLDSGACLLPNSPYFVEDEIPVAASVNISSGFSQIVADGNSTAMIRARVIDTNGNPLEGQAVEFSSNLGSFTSDNIVVTDSDGVAKITLKASSFPGVATVTAEADGFTDQLEMVMTALSPETLSLTAVPSPVVPGGEVVVIATIKDRLGNPVPGEQLNLQIEINRTGGNLNSVSEFSDVNGQVILIYTAGDLLGTDRLKVTLNSNQSISDTFDVVVRWEGFAVGSIDLELLGEADIPADSNRSAAIQATILDTAGEPVPEGTMCVFTTTKGHFSNGDVVESHVTTDDEGILVVSLMAGSEGIAEVTARCGGVSQAIAISFSDADGPTEIFVDDIEIAAGTLALEANGTSKTVIRATVTDIGGAPAVGVTVDFSTTLGTVDPVSVPTNASGIAQTTLTSAANTGIATVTATTATTGFVDSLEVKFTGAPPSTIDLTDGPLNVAPGDTLTLMVTVTDGTNPISGETIKFNFVTNSSGASLPEPPTAVTNINGEATIEYTAGLVEGTDRVRAESISNSLLSDSVDITVAAGAGGAMLITTFELTASNDEIVADGVSNTAIRAYIADEEGDPVVGMDVSFSASYGTLSAATAETGPTGIAEVILTSSSTVGLSVVTASITGFSDQVEVNFVAGPPVDANSTIVVQPSAIPADGTSTAEVTVTLADDDGNPVADGTPVDLYTSRGTITSDNPAETVSGRAVFTIRAPLTTGTATISLWDYPDITSTTLAFGTVTSGEPASILIESVSNTEIAVTGVGQNDNTAITARIVDETGTTVVDPNLSLLVTLLAKPDGGEVISGEAPTPPGGLVTDTDEIEIDASSGSGTFNLRSGILPGVVEIRLQVYENGSAYTTSLGTAVVIVTPQISIASGPPHTMVLSAPTVDAIVNLNDGPDSGIPLTPGFYSRRAGLIVTDRYGNAVPDGTTINLGFLDSVISAGEQGETLGDFRMRDNSGIDFTADTIIRDGLIREIEPNDRVVLFDVPAEDVSRFVDAGGIFANRVLATKAYNNTASNLEYAVGASLLGGSIYGTDGATATKGTVQTDNGLAQLRLVYPAQRERILCGCYGTGVTNPTAADYQFGTTDKRFLRGSGAAAENTGRTISVFTSSDDNVSMASEGTLCFSAIAGFTLEAVPDEIGGPAGTYPIALTLYDGGDEVLLPFVAVSYGVVVDGATLTASATTGRTDEFGNLIATITVAGGVSDDTATFTFYAGDASVEVTYTVP